jgi:hypothetical protein
MHSDLIEIRLLHTRELAAAKRLFPPLLDPGNRTIKYVCSVSEGTTFRVRPAHYDESTSTTSSSTESPLA